MTNEEIEQKVDAVVRELEEEQAYEFPELREQFVALARSLVLQAYEEAIKAQCEMCRKRIPARKSFWSGYAHIMQTATPDPPSLPYDLLEPCKAAEIHTLKDFLVAEFVSS